MPNTPSAEAFDKALDNIVLNEAWLGGDLTDELLSKYPEAILAIKQAIATHIIGEDEDRNHRLNRNWKVEIDARNFYRAEQLNTLYPTNNKEI